MKHIIAALFMLLGTSLISSAQKHRLPVKVERVTVRHTDPHHKTELKKHLTITITNESIDNYYFWVGHNPTDINDCDRMLIRKYFRRVPEQCKNDPEAYTFAHIIWNNIEFGYTNHFTPEIGFNFLKLIHPGTKFTLTIPDDKKSFKYYYDRLVYVPEDSVVKMIGGIPEVFNYEGHSITVPPNCKD